jgi:Zn-dependent peptidase ImmA (M78 family)
MTRSDAPQTSLARLGAIAIAALLALTPTAALHAHGGDAETPDMAPTNGLLDQADAIAKDVAVIRGLPLKSPLKKDVQNREQLREALISRIAKEYTDEEIINEGRLYERLGLFPEGLDYKKLILDLLTAQIAGFYDQDIKALYIMSGLPEALQRPTMAHEIFHALQDQHFDILEMQAAFSPKENSDFQIARSALIEGDATVLMIDFTLREEKQLPQGDVASIAQMPMIAGTANAMTIENMTSLQDLLGSGGESAGSSMESVPPSLQESLIFPYIGGLRFVLLAYQKLGSWEKVDEIYSMAPVSTEQIIHPERYFAKDMPVLIDFEAKDALGSEWSEIYRNVVGEFQMHLTLKQHLRLLKKPGAPIPGVNLPEAVEGWGGDKILAFENKDKKVLIAHMSNWDTVEDAEQYYVAINGALARRFHGEQLVVQTTRGGHGESTCYTLGEGADAERLYVERWGDMVLHIEGVPHTPMPEGKHKEALVFKLRDASFDTLKRTDFLPEYEARMKAYAEKKALEAKEEAPTPKKKQK